MRAKVIIATMVLALALLVPAVYFRYYYKPATPPPAVEQPVVEETAPPAASGPSILKRVAQAQGRPQEGLPDQPGDTGLVGNDHTTYVIRRRAELTDLGMSDNPANLKVILSEMENPDAGIRQAALAAAVDFGSKDAIPALQNEMNWAADPEEKVAIKKAIEFLELPSFGAVVQQSDSSAPATN